MNSIQEMQERQQQRIGDLEAMLQSPFTSQEESKTTTSTSFPRMGGSITDSNTRRNVAGLGQRTLYQEDTHHLGMGAGAYNLNQALNGDPLDLHEMNESSALQRILNRDVNEPMFPTGSRHDRASHIMREMRDERLRRANPGIQSNLNRGLFPERRIAGVD